MLRCGRPAANAAKKGDDMYYLKNIGIVARCSEMFRDERFSALGLNGRQSVCLLHICRRPGITQDALCKSLFIDKSNVTRQMALLEETGYVTRCPDPSDRRQVCVYPTEKALDTLPAIREGFSQWRAYLNAALSDEELSMLCQIADKLANRAAAYCGRIVTEEEA